MASAEHTAGDNVVRMVDDLVGRAITRRASDIHVEPSETGVFIRYRMDGLLRDVDQLPAHLAENVIARLKVMAGLLTYRKDIPQEGAFRVGNGARENTPSIDVRVATFPTVCGERAALRLLYAVGQVSGLGDLGFPAGLVSRLRQGADQPQGMILVTGPAGSGKSTTLYALARHIRTSTPGRSVITLEDPVEQRLPGVAQIQVQPHGELDYVRAMRSLLRQDVQVLLVGEIRDAETAHIVVEAALTGHLIMSTLHSGDPAEAIVRLLEMGIAPYQLAGALTLVCTQRLLRTVCPTCRGQGSCDVCLSSGYLGRTACGQVAQMDDRLRGAILERRPAGELRRLIGDSGPDLAADARRLVENGRTTLDEVRRVLGSLDGDTRSGE